MATIRREGHLPAAPFTPQLSPGYTTPSQCGSVGVSIVARAKTAEELAAEFARDKSLEDRAQETAPGSAPESVIESVAGECIQLEYDNAAASAWIPSELARRGYSQRWINSEGKGRVWAARARFLREARSDAAPAIDSRDRHARLVAAASVGERMGGSEAWQFMSEEFQFLGYSGEGAVSKMCKLAWPIRRALLIISQDIIPPDSEEEHPI